MDKVKRLEGVLQFIDTHSRSNTYANFEKLSDKLTEEQNIEWQSNSDTSSNLYLKHLNLTKRDHIISSSKKTNSEFNDFVKDFRTDVEEALRRLKY